MRAVAEGRDELAGREVGFVAQAPPRPPVGVEAVEPGHGGGVGQRHHGRDDEAAVDLVGRRTVGQLTRLEHGAHHDRALTEADRLEHAPLEQRAVVIREARLDVRVEEHECDRPPERGEEVRHRRDVQQHHVARDACGSGGFVDPLPAARDLGQEAVLRCTRGQEVTHLGLDPGQRGALRVPVGGPGHPLRVHERLGPVQLLEVRDQPVQPRRGPGGITHPAAQREPVAQPASEREHLERAAVAELVELPVDRRVEMAEVALDLLGAEQVMGERAAIGEQLVRQLAQEHAVVRQPLARDAFRECVELAERRR